MHALHDFLFYGNDGKLRLATLDRQTVRAACLHLVANAIVAWNLVAAQHALDRLTIGLALAVGVAFTAPAGARVAKWHKCSGVVRLADGDTASSITARNLACREVRRVIKAPASKRGYRCSNPFERPKGSGGWVVCHKGTRTIKFLYSQS
jgi:hypothetical protein